MGSRQILCRPEDMVLTEWLRPVYEGVPQIVAGLPVRLAHWGDLLASGNRRSTWSDATDGIPGPDTLPFAGVRQRGAGYAALICANVSDDVWLEGSPHNTRWLVNTCTFLHGATHAEKRRAGSVLRSDERLFLSHALADKATAAEVHRLLEREQAVGTWFDEQQMLPGDDLPHHIQEGLRAATLMVLFWSESAARSEWVRRELEMAGRASLDIIVVRLDPTDVPGQYANLLRIESVDLDPAEIVAQLVRALRGRRLRGRLAAIAERVRAAPSEEGRRDGRELETPV
jgi:hypothetical protein